jgi:hypothetical protein
MYKVKFVKPIKTTSNRVFLQNPFRLLFLDDIYSQVKQAYIDDNTLVPYLAANKQLQLRLTQFVSKGRNFLHYVYSRSSQVSQMNNHLYFFYKVNSNRVYALEKHDDSIRLMMLIKEKDETSMFP